MVETTPAISTTSPCETALPEKPGFRVGKKGTHTSRTIMLAELTALLDTVPKSASPAEYRAAIIEGNVLGKKTAATRNLSAQRLCELYALDQRVALFRQLRVLWDHDKEGRPLLALLCACGRDPLLRATVQTILGFPHGEIVPTSAFERALTEMAGSRFNPATLSKIARNVASSWTQSGHLVGKYEKRRSRPVATPANTAYALALGYLAGQSGQVLLDCFWTRLLDVSSARVTSLTQEASRKGWLTFRAIGNTVEIRFPDSLIPNTYGAP